MALIVATNVSSNYSGFFSMQTHCKIVESNHQRHILVKRNQDGIILLSRWYDREEIHPFPKYLLMTIHPRCFHLHRLFTCPIAHLLLERHTDLVPNQVIDLRTDVFGDFVSSRPLKREHKVLMTLAAALEFLR